jgi:sterol desaturase/sphingolipid hydroxylase (fatty acid hydroxylase superfamily)
MGKFITNKNETVRLFDNPVLEYFSHIHPATPVLTYVPVVGVMLWLSWANTGIMITLAFFSLGLLFWTLTEYVIHRWVFHYQPTSAFGKKIHFLVHGVHHDYPRDATRLVMPLLVSVPLAVLFFFAFKMAFTEFHFGIFAGFMAGYVTYDSIHYATHHMKMEGRIGRFLKRYHLKHHYNDEHTAYGVSTPLWDYVFGTVPDELKGKK